MKNYQELRDLAVSAETEAKSFFEKGNKAAGTRLRKAMMEIIKLAKAVRVDVSEKKNA